LEVSFSKEIETLRLGAGDTFHGEGILAITKGLLQSGVAYVGGYQGAPVSHLLDVMVQAKPYMDELGVHVEACSNEASAAAMLGASIHYPLRGAVTWKSIVGTNVAADALSNLASPGVKGGVLIVVGEDYGEGASVIQERTHAYALKSGMCLLDPRPDLGVMVQHGGARLPALRVLEHALHDGAAHPRLPRARQLRMQEQPGARDLDTRADGRAGRLRLHAARAPARHLPPREAEGRRAPAGRAPLHRREPAQRADPRHARRPGHRSCRAGSTTRSCAACSSSAWPMPSGDRHPLLVLNVAYPLVPEQVADFCVGKRARAGGGGRPARIHRAGDRHAAAPRDIQTPLHGCDMLPAAGEYGVEVLATGLAQFAQRYLPQHAQSPAHQSAQGWLTGNRDRRAAVATQLEAPLPARPPSFCIGCPERPVFAALKLAQQDSGPVHIAADIGCHAFGTFEPFSMGHSILGYGMSLASRAGVSPMMQRRALSIMGDGGFWHNGLLTGVQSALFNGDDAVLLIFKNGYTSATGTQDIISTPDDETKEHAVDKQQSLVDKNQTIESTLKGLGVQWLRTVHTYHVDKMRKTLNDAFTSDFNGLKVIIAEGECQLERQRRIKPWIAGLLRKGERVVRVKYGVDEDVCNGDHACIRLSGCPTLTIKDNPDPLKVDPVAVVIDGCVGCGLCGENAHAATLCPSFYRAEVVQNPKWHERLLHSMRGAVVRAMQPA
jgi:indolepyruvate ferredoxin oxidoreductase alpha subunit